MKKIEGFNSKAIFRFKPKEKVTHCTIYPEVTGGGAPMLRGSFTITVHASFKRGDEGVLLSNGDNVGGYALYIQDGKLKYHFNYLGYKHFQMESDIEIPEGNHQFAFDFVETHTNSGIGRLLIDGRPSGSVYINTKPLFATHFGRLSLGKFSHISITGDMKEKKNFEYTNVIEKADFDFARLIDDMDMMLKMEEELKRE
jgi:arylsulfatase